MIAQLEKAQNFTIIHTNLFNRQMDQKIETGDLAIIGIPVDENSSYMKGASEAPQQIREAYYSSSANLSTESCVDLHHDQRIKFLEDYQHIAYHNITQSVSDILNQGASVVSMGGDHSITYPIIEAYAQKYPNLHILQLDAHCDLYDDFEGNPNSHASPFARIMEKKLAKGLLQVGIRSMTPHQKEQANRFKVEVLDMRHWQTYRSPLPVNLGAPLYLSIDLDVLDPAFAPGVSHYEPGGMTTREVIQIIQQLPYPIVGADIVELNPRRDQQGMTAMVAAKLLKEIIGNMLSC